MPTSSSTTIIATNAVKPCDPRPDQVEQRAAPARRGAHIRLGPTRSASLPSGTAKTNDDDAGDGQAEADLGGGQPDDLGEEDRAAGEEGALADREEDRLAPTAGGPAASAAGTARSRWAPAGFSQPSLAFVAWISCGPTGRRARRLAGLLAAETGALRRRDVGLDRARPSGWCSRGARCSRRCAATARRLGGAGPLAAGAARVRTSRGCRSSAARWSPGTEPVLLDDHASLAEAARPRAVRRTSRWCRPSCTGCSSRRTTGGARAASRPCCSAAGRWTAALRARAAGRRASGWWRRTARPRPPAAACTTGCPLDGVAVAIGADGRIRIGGPTLFDGYDGDPALTAEVLVDGWFLTADAGRLRRGRPAPGARPGRRRGDLAAGSTCPPPRSRPGCASTRRWRRSRWSASPDDEWGQRVVAVRRRRRLAVDEARDWVAEAHPRVVGAARAGGPRRAAAARQRQGGPAAAAGAGVTGATGLLDPDAHPLPRHHRARGRAAPRRRPGGASGARSSSTTPPTPSRGCAAPRRRPPATGRRRCGTPVPVNVTVPAVGPERAHEIVLAGGCTHRQGQGRRARPDARPTTRPGSRRSATRSARDGRIRVDANGAWDVDERGRARSGSWTGPPAGWSTSSSRARRVEELAAVRRRGGRPDRRRRVDPPGRGPLPGARPRGGRHRRAQGAAARRGAGLPADRRGHRPAGRRSPAPSRPRSASPPGVALAAALPELPYACGLATVQLLTDDVVADPLLPVDGMLPVGLPWSYPAALDRLAARPGAGRALGGAGWPRCAAAAAGSPLVTTPRPHAGPRASSTPWSTTGVAEVVVAPGSRNAPLAFAA